MAIVTSKYPAISRCGLKVVYVATVGKDYVEAKDIEPLLARYKKLSDYLANSPFTTSEAAI